MIEDMIVAERLAQLTDHGSYRNRHRRDWHMAQQRVVVERPTLDATRILARWLAARGVASRTGEVTGVAAANLVGRCPGGQAATGS
ncbi:MAG: hypothetical protein ACYDCQ_10985 [Dehalococcoidia bacterium]